MAMLAIPLSNDISRLFQEFDLDIEKDFSNHITLFYFGDNLPISRILKIIPIIFDITENLSPFVAETSEYSCFDSDDLYPVICPVKSKQLMNIRSKIKNQFEHSHIKYDKTFSDYKPHITLGYSQEKYKKTKFPKVEFTISQIALYGGDTVDTKLFVNFPLTITKKSTLDILSSQYLKYSCP
jgi:2'-5' RNA ligase